MKQAVKVLTFLVCLSIGLFSWVFESEARADSAFNRLGGLDRYATAVEISQAGWQDSSEVAVLATGENYPDALAAAPLAKKFNAPILLTRKNSIPQETMAELIRLGVKKVYIAGGSSVISQQVESRLVAKSIIPVRLAGADRYETAVKIAEHVGAVAGEVFVASGQQFADALSVSPIAALKGIPIILTDSDTLPATVENYLAAADIRKTYALGGADLISDSVVGCLPGPERISGRNKYERNINIIKRFESELNFSQACLATGEKYPDALAGSVYASLSASPIILVDDSNTQNTSYNYLQAKNPEIQNMSVFGLEGALSQQAVEGLTGVSAPDNQAAAPDSTAGDPGISGQDSSAGNTFANISNEGFVTENDGQMYYCRGGSLNKAKLDGTEEIQILADGSSPRYINVVGDWIYYLHYLEGIWKVRTDGTDKTKVFTDFSGITSKHRIVNMGVSGSYLYFIDWGSYFLYRLNLDGSGLEVLAQDVGQYYVQGNKIYYRTYLNAKPGLYSMNLDGTGQQRIFDLNSPFDVAGDWIYYTESPDRSSIARVLYKAKLDGTSKTRLADTGSVNSINVYDGWIYYESLDSEEDALANRGSLYKVGIDGSAHTCIYYGNAVHKINVVDGWFYCLRVIDRYGYVYRMKLDGSGLESL